MHLRRLAPLRSSAVVRGDRASLRRAVPLYVGAFLGPFGATVLSPNIPGIAADLDVSVELVGAAITAYMTPFALLQLASPAVTRRIDPRRLVRLAFGLYAVGALLCALAPSFGVFLLALALMGTANAFLSPLLLAALADVVAPAVLGRAVGTFMAVQTAGFMLGPAFSGIVGEASWRLVYVAVACLGIPLALSPMAVRSVAATPQQGRLTAVLDRRMAVLGLAAFLGWGSLTSIGFIVVLLLDERFETTASVLGIVLAASGIGGVVLGRPAGAACDRVGRAAVALFGALVASAITFTLPLGPSVVALGLLYLALGCAATFLWTALGTIATEMSTGDNRAAAISAYNFCRFASGVFAPVLLSALFAWNERAPFVVASAIGLVVAGLTLPWFAWYRDGSMPAQPRVELSDVPA